VGHGSCPKGEGDMAGISDSGIVVGSQYFLNTGRIDDDGRFPVDRALVLADSAARTLFFLNDGALFVVPDNSLIGTLLIADQTDLLCIPGNASCFIDMCDPHLDEAFFFHGKRFDRCRGANPTTEITKLFAVADPGNESRGVEAGQTGFQESRLEGIVGTDFQTLPASRAHGHKFVFRQGSGRSNQTIVL
jgi:hypothetical protein